MNKNHVLCIIVLSIIFSCVLSCNFSGEDAPQIEKQDSIEKPKIISESRPVLKKRNDSPPVQGINARPVSKSKEGEDSSSVRHEAPPVESIRRLEACSDAPEESRLTLYKQQKAYQGLNFYVPAHEPSALLMDMEGKILHVWKRELKSVWPESYEKEGKNVCDYWRCAELLENGDVLALFDNYGLIRVDKDSSLIWSYPGLCHDDFCIGFDGNIYILTWKERLIPQIDESNPVREDFITILTEKGKPIKNISVYKCLENSQYSYYLEDIDSDGDIFHTNAVEVFDGTLEHLSPWFKKGNALISIRRLNIVAVIDLLAEKMLWAQAGPWKRQHGPVLLPDGHVLIFDSEGNDGFSRIIEYDPIIGKTIWTFEGDPPHSFSSKACGTNQRLPNGNTLITESSKGRAFEVTPDKEFVWEYIISDSAGLKHDLNAVLFEMKRMPADFSPDWTEN